ncbi:c-type cytochrome [Thioalkalivibrio sp.]|uniref:c-type cytochrome n=1 Tax=Thioalkalivibrio sp. TaxID=2093813 RepID=UPI0035649CD0
MTRKTLGAALITGLIAVGTGAAANEIASGELLAFQCAGCHGFNGHSVGPATPSIAGFSEDYFVQAMLDYKEGNRYATIMDRIAWGYSQEEFEAMAEFFAAQPYLPARQGFDADLAELGADIHDRYCGNCHSEGGTYAEYDSAQLAGQWIPYLEDAFEDFIEHGRPQPRGMQRRLADFSDADVQALIHYYASQQDPAAYVHAD